MTDFLQSQYKAGLAQPYDPGRAADSLPRNAGSIPVAPPAGRGIPGDATQQDKVQAVFDTRPVGAQDIYFEYVNAINYTVPQGYNLILKKIRGNSYGDAAMTLPVIIETGLQLNVYSNATPVVINDPNYRLASVFDAPLFAVIPESAVLTGQVVAQAALITSPYNLWIVGGFTTAFAWQRIAFGNGLFVAINSANSQTAISSDGINWVLGSLPASAFQWEDIKFGNGVFMAVNFGSNQAAISYDGFNWTAITLPNTVGFAIHYAAGVWVLATNTAGVVTTYTSANNGATWAAGVAFAANISPAIIAYGAGLFVMCGNGFVYSSSDGLNWTQRAVFGADVLNGLVYAGGQFVIIDATAPRAITSPDGVNWTQRGLLVAANINQANFAQSLAYANGSYKIGGGISGNSYTSQDGITWTLETNTLQNTTVSSNGNSIVAELAAAGTARSAYYTVVSPTQITAGGLTMKYAIEGMLIPTRGRNPNLAPLG